MLECLSRPLAVRYAKNYTFSLLKKSIVKLLNRAELIFQVFIQISDFSVTIWLFTTTSSCQRLS